MRPALHTQRAAQTAAIEGIRAAIRDAAPVLAMPTPAPHAYDLMREIRSLMPELAALVKDAGQGVLAAADDWHPESDADIEDTTRAIHVHVDQAIAQLGDVEHGALARIQERLSPMGSTALRAEEGL